MYGSFHALIQALDGPHAPVSVTRMPMDKKRVVVTLCHLSMDWKQDGVMADGP